MPHPAPVEYGYDPEWATLPEFSSWLRPDPTSTKHVLCCICDIQLKAGIGYIRRHTRRFHPEAAPSTPWPRRQRHFKYNPKWQKRPELRGWLCRSPRDPDFAFCRPCNRQLRPTYDSVRKHAGSRRHEQRCRRPAAAPCGPSAEAVSADQDAPSAADTDGVGEEKTRKNRAATIEMWQQRPEFAPWLRRSAADRHKAFCLVCYKEVTPKLIILQKHGASSLHKRHASLSKGASGAGEYHPLLQPQADADSPPSPSSPSPAGGGAVDEVGGKGLSRSPRPAGADNAVYNPAWERRPELAPWIARGPDHPRRAYCRVCRMEITPKLAHVRRHGASKRHVQKAQAAGQEVVLLGEIQEAAGDPELQVSTSEQILIGEAGFDAVGAGEDVTGEVRAGAVVEQGAVETAGDEGTAEAAADETRTASVIDHDPDPDAPDAETQFHARDEDAPSRKTTQQCLPRLRRMYQPVWEKVPELSDWLCRSPWDERRPFCRWCRREVTPKLAHLRRHASSGLHRNARPATARGKELGQEGSGRSTEPAGSTETAAETAADRDSGGKTSEDQPAELGPFGTCLVCKHPLVVRLNIFRARTKPSRRLVASVLSLMVQQPLTEESCDRASSEICTACASLLDTADELQNRLSAVENEVILKFKSPSPLSVTHLFGENSASKGHELPDSGLQWVSGDSSQSGQNVSAPLQGTGTALQGEPVAYITIGDADQDTSTVIVRTETLDNGDLVIYREPAGLTQPEPPVDMFSDSLALVEEVSPQESLPDPALQTAELASPPVVPRGTRGRARPRPPAVRAPDEPRTFDCVFCHCSFRTSLSLHQHWNQEHPLQLQPCPHCPKRFLYRSSLKQHIRTHEPLRYTCDQCGRRFAANCDLKKHVMFVHSEVKRFPCGLCGRAFKLKWMLGRHVRLVHEDDR